MKQRLENLKGKMHTQWGYLAERLGISRSMLDMTRKGERSFGPETMVRLEELENEVGIYSHSKSVNAAHNEHALVKEAPASYHAPPACDTERLDRLEQAVTELTKTMREQNEAMLANMNAMNTVLLRLLAEQETGDNKDSNGLAG